MSEKQTVNINLEKIKNSAPSKYSNFKISDMTSEIRHICLDLACPVDNFDVKKTFYDILLYTKKYDRLLYSEISAHCYDKENKNSFFLQPNINALVEYVYSDEFEENLLTLSKNDARLYRKTRRIVIKLYDNINLAYSQSDSFTQSQEALRTSVKYELAPFKDEITKEMSSQLITLVGIFTAIAFLVFGGFDTLLSIFSNISTKPVSKVIMLASIWGLVVCNGVLIMFYCIEKITNTGKDVIVYSNVSKWANWILLLVFSLSSWVYFVDIKNIGGWLIHIIKKFEYSIGIAGAIFIIAFFGLIAYFLCKRNKNQNT